MAVIIHIFYTGSEGNARKFAEEMTERGIVSAIRQEEGNLGYDYFLPMGDSETVLLIDRWADQGAIDAHHRSPMMAEIARLREKYDLRMRVERYVTDEGGVPDSDKKYLRT